MENKEKYLAPDLTVVSFKIERGFQASTTQEADMFELFQEGIIATGYDNQNKQSWENGGTLGGS